MNKQKNSNPFKSTNFLLKFHPFKKKKTQKKKKKKTRVNIFFIIILFIFQSLLIL